MWLTYEPYCKVSPCILSCSIEEIKKSLDQLEGDLNYHRISIFKLSLYTHSIQETLFILHLKCF